MPNKGRFIVNAIADGHDVSVPFTNMDVKLPILSARQMMTKGSRMLLTEEDGEIYNPRTDETIRFIIFDDLWFMKMKVKPPIANTSAMNVDPICGPCPNPGNSQLPFGRQGP